MMAKENDIVQLNSNNNSDKFSATVAVTSGVGFPGTHSNNSNDVSQQADRKDTDLNAAEGAQGDKATCSHGKLNDLVADVCLNGHRPHGDYDDDYANARATAGTSVKHENLSAKGQVGVHNQTTQFESFGGTASIPGSSSDCNNSAAAAAVSVASTHVVQPPTQNSSFSFKHFLSSSSVLAAPSTTVTSLDPVCVSGTSTSATATTSVHSLQTSTGARPKVPQTASASTTSISSLGGGLPAGAVGGQDLPASTSTTKMKRSPRFSSFDSQASLAECVGVNSAADLSSSEAAVPGGGSGDYRLYSEERENDHFNGWNAMSNAQTLTTNSSDYERGQYVPRSYSNYDMPRSQTHTSPRRRLGTDAIKETRPTRLGLNVNCASKLKLFLPLNSANSGNSNSRKGGSISRTLPGAEFQPVAPPTASAPAAALPDFVQDHWMDSWYAHDMHLHSPPTSPIPVVFEDLNGAAGGCAGGGAVRNSDAGVGGIVPGIGSGADGVGGGCSNSINIPELSSVGSKMLPDFLSDGPIIHSSQRLADIAAGLPSNSIGSPEDSTITSQLSRLLTENERLQRELNETRAALNEQTRRANDFERQLHEERQRQQQQQQQQQRQQPEVEQQRTSGPSLPELGDQQRQQQKQHKDLQQRNEESAENNKRRNVAAQSHIAKLKQHVTQLTAEVNMLRREKELMREEGAVGGCSVPSCDRPYSAAAAAVSSSRSNMGRPSKTQQISRDLLRAATNAENNLRQLLVGVDNLRQMAANIENSESRLDYDASPDLFSEFLDECDDYEEYPGGPAL